MRLAFMVQNAKKNLLGKKPKTFQCVFQKRGEHCFENDMKIYSQGQDVFLVAHICTNNDILVIIFVNEKFDANELDDGQ